MEAGAPDRESSEPKPDLAVLAEVKADFKVRHPRCSELLLIVEAADSSLYQDAAKKRGLYARAGVPEYWVFDSHGRRLLVHRELNSQTAPYGSVLGYAEHETIAVACRPSPRDPGFRAFAVN